MHFLIGPLRAACSQAVVLLLPRFARHMPAALRASLLPGWIKTLAADSHWNVRAEVPQLLISLLTPQDPQQQQQQQPSSFPQAAASSSSSSAEGGSSAVEGGGEATCFACDTGQAVMRWGRVTAGATTAAAGCVADSWAPEDLRVVR